MLHCDTAPARAAQLAALLRQATHEGHSMTIREWRAREPVTPQGATASAYDPWIASSLRSSQ